MPFKYPALSTTNDIHNFYIDMVVSGLPVRNGDQHAGEIASMALQLLTSINGVGYKHVENSQVQLRIGMHTGKIFLFLFSGFI